MKNGIFKLLTVLVLAATTTSCFGPFRLTNKLYAWNDQASQKKFVKELVFIGLSIIPAYELFVLGDCLIFNSIEFWGGGNPLAMKEGETSKVDFEHEGKIYEVTTRKNEMSIAMAGSEESVDFRYFPEDKCWFQMDGERKGMAIK